MSRQCLLRSARAAGLLGGWRAWLLSALLLFTGIVLSACGGGGGSGAAGSSGTGTVTIGLTDADGDFLTYAVDVTALTLTRADGAVVNALPVKTRVDFAQYTDLTEFLNAATVPAGSYHQVNLTLDYTNADIRVASGANALPVTPRDSAGNPVGILTLQVQLDDNKPLVVRPGIPADLTLDFDLEATNTVDLNAATVTVAPVLIADVDLANPKPRRVRGPLLSVDPAASEFIVAIRPFHLLLGDFGRLTVQTDGNTTYEIDRVSYQGAPGLAQLAAAPRATATVAVGNFDATTHAFLATEVYAGSSVAFGNADVVTGSVIARSGNTLTVRGATLARANGTVSFNDDVTVTLAGTTKVMRQLGGAVTTDDISVGSRVTALGTLAGTTLDASNGLVRIVLSSVAGIANQIDPGLITMNLQTINGRPVSIYDFSGTGGSSADSNASAYRVATGGLDLGTLATSDPVRVRGFVVAYGQAVTHDYDARTVIDLSGVPAWLAVSWNTAVPNPFTSLTDQAMVTDITGSALHAVFQRGVATDLAGNPTVQPDGAGNDLFVIARNNTIQLYGTFAAFSDALNLQLAAAHPVKAVGARGGWDGNTLTVTSGFTVVRLQ